MKRSAPILIATLSLSILYTLPVSAIKASEPFIQQEQLNQARQLEQWKKDRAVLPRIKVEKAVLERHTQEISPSMAALCGRNSSRRSTGRTGFLERQGACLRKAEIEHERHRETGENTQSKAAR